MIDATFIEANKNTAKWSYKDAPGYMPMVGHIEDDFIAYLGCFWFQKNNLFVNMKVFEILWNYLGIDYHKSISFFYATISAQGKLCKSTLKSFIFYYL